MKIYRSLVFKNLPDEPAHEQLQQQQFASFQQDKLLDQRAVHTLCRLPEANLFLLVKQTRLHTRHTVFSKIEALKGLFYFNLF